MDAASVNASGRDKLLAAARRYFSSLGYEGTTVARLLEEAGLQPPTLYYHFDDKEGLYMAWLREAAAELGVGVERAARTPGTLEERLAAVAMVLLDPGRPDVVRLRRDARALTTPAHRQEAIGLSFKAVFEPLMTLLLAAEREGKIRHDPLDGLAQIFVMATMGFHPHYALQSREPESAARYVATRFLRGASERQ